MSIVYEPMILADMEDGIGRLVRAKREELGLTQTALAEASGLSKGHLSTIEAGKIALPAPDIRRRLAQALGVPHVELLIAANEITREELGADAPSREIEDDDELKLALLRAVRHVDWRTPDAAAVGRSLMRQMLGVRQDQRQANARRAPAGSGQGA